MASSSPRVRRTFSSGSSSSKANKRYSRAYFHSPTLLLRPKTSQRRFEQENPPPSPKPEASSQAKDDEKYERYMKTRFHSFLAKKHATTASEPVQLIDVQSEDSLKVPPRDEMTPLVVLHRIAAKLDSQAASDQPRADLCHQTLVAIGNFMAASARLANSTAPTDKLVSYLKRCIYSNQPTAETFSSDGDISYIPYFDTYSKFEKKVDSLKSKYDKRTGQNRDLSERIAQLQQELAEVQHKLADREYKTIKKSKQAKRISRDLQVTQASYLGMAEEFRKLQTRCSNATREREQYKLDYENALAKTKALEIANSDLQDEVDRLKGGLQQLRKSIPRTPSRRFRTPPSRLSSSGSVASQSTGTL